MLKPAKNYESELRQKLRDTWYDEDYKFYHSDSYRGDFNLDDDSRWFFVSVDSDNNVIGYISFVVDRDVNQVRNCGAISFDIGNTIFAKDLISLLDDIFMKYHFNRLEWCCVEGNPVMPSYIRWCSKHGGQQVAREHECVRTIDDVLRGSFTFEILSKNYINIKRGN